MFTKTATGLISTVRSSARPPGGQSPSMVLRVTIRSRQPISANDIEDKLVAFGNDGDDQLGGTNGDDSLFGGAGDDTLYTSGANDHVEGGTGKDTIHVLAGTFDGGPGADHFYNGYTDDARTIVGGSGRDVMHASEFGNLTASGIEVLFVNGGSLRCTPDQLASFEAIDQFGKISIDLLDGGSIDFSEKARKGINLTAIVPTTALSMVVRLQRQARGERRQ